MSITHTLPISGLGGARGQHSACVLTSSRALAKEIKADTSAIRVDAAGIKDDIGQILAEIARLRSLIPAGEEAAGAHEQNFVLQRYLDDLTSYAETVCGETLESASVNDAPEGVAKYVNSAASTPHQRYSLLKTHLAQGI